MRRAGGGGQLTRPLQGTGQVPQSNLNTFPVWSGTRQHVGRVLNASTTLFSSSIFTVLLNATRRRSYILEGCGCGSDQICGCRRKPSSMRSPFVWVGPNWSGPTPRSSTSAWKPAWTCPCYTRPPGKPSWSAIIPLTEQHCGFDRRRITSSSSEQPFDVLPAPLGTTVADVCEPAKESSLAGCPHELWLSIGTEEPRWAAYTKFTLRISWPASVSPPIV